MNTGWRQRAHRRPGVQRCVPGRSAYSVTERRRQPARFASPISLTSALPCSTFHVEYRHRDRFETVFRRVFQPTPEKHSQPGLRAVRTRCSRGLSRRGPVASEIRRRGYLSHPSRRSPRRASRRRLRVSVPCLCYPLRYNCGAQWGKKTTSEALFIHPWCRCHRVLSRSLTAGALQRTRIM